MSRQARDEISIVTSRTGSSPVPLRGAVKGDSIYWSVVDNSFPRSEFRLCAESIVGCFETV